MGSTIHIADEKYLYQLSSAQTHAYESIMNLCGRIEQDCNKLMKGMEEKKKLLEDRLKVAERNYRNAEAAYGRCCASQKWDDEDKCYRPSCDCEAAAKARYQKEYVDLMQRAQKADRVIEECERKLDEYCSFAENVKNTLSEKQLKSEERMSAIIDKVSDYNSSSVSIDSGASCESGVNNDKNKETIDKNKEAINKEKIKKYKDATEKIKKLLSSTDGDGGTPTAPLGTGGGSTTGTGNERGARTPSIVKHQKGNSIDIYTGFAQRGRSR